MRKKEERVLSKMMGSVLTVPWPRFHSESIPSLWEKKIVSWNSKRALWSISRAVTLLGESLPHPRRAPQRGAASAPAEAVMVDAGHLQRKVWLWARPQDDLLRLLLSPCSRVWLWATPKTSAHQALPSLGFSRQEHWSGLPFPSPMHENEKWKWSHSVVSDS